MSEKKTDILLIHPNDQKAVYGDTIKYVACEPPYWCAVTAQYCLDRGYSVEVMDAEAENLSFEQVAERAKKSSPVLIGIYVTGTNLSASTQKMQGADETCAAIKRVCDIPVFFWGLHPSALPERTLEENDADYVVTGEGYDTVTNLIRYHRGDGLAFNKEKLPGLCYRGTERIERFGVAPLFDLEDVPMPAWQLLPMERYMPHNWHIMGEDRPEDARGRYAVISASVGCPYNCSYCAISALFGTKKLRFWSIDRVLDEIDRLVNEYNIKYIKILDECFVLKKDYVAEFCDRLAERNYDLNMWAYARVDTVDPEILAKLKKAGVRWLAYGIESADDEVLSEVSKSQYNADKTRRAMAWTKDANINILANFMFGLPDDTEESMEKSLRLCREINPEWINFYVTMPYPGSKDYFDAVKAGKIKNDRWIEYAQYSYDCIPSGSKYLTPKEVLAYRDYAFNAFFEDNDEYFNLIKDKFGQQYVDSIKNMTKGRLRR
ncbi:MAG: B12-binding domain-containing radical SAM protein, partial [Eubacterium sp.]|nr:B12-binding domain-containing radical SAM protein [Eubacterium sp.]